MNPAGIISTGVLLLLLGAIIPTYAQQEEAKPPKKEQQAKPEKKQQNKAAKHQQQGQAKGQQQQARGQQQQQQRAQQRRQGQNKQQQQKQQQARGQQQQRQRQVNQPSQQEQRGHAGEHRAVWQEHRAHNWQSEHRNWRERGGYNGYRIPNDRYRGHFGPNHWFRVYRYPVEMYGGYPRFQYGGFWFGFMDPWPEYWAANWYENDDVYIVYSEDGYYLYNRRHPRDRIAITVYVN